MVESRQGSNTCGYIETLGDLTTICSHERTRIDDGISTCLDCADRLDCDSLDGGVDASGRSPLRFLLGVLIGVLTGVLVVRLVTR